MVRKTFAFPILGAMIIFVCSVSSADVPDSINYQGKLTGPGGGPVNGTFDMTFSIYPDTLPGTMADWSEPQAQVEVERGIFSVLLGSVNPIPAWVFDGTAKYLGIQVDTDPEMRPLKPMVTVPYAFRSQEADTADYARSRIPDDDWVIDGNNVYHEEGGVAIGASDPGQRKLYVQGGDVLIAQGELRVWRNLDEQGASFRIGYDPNYSLAIKRGYNHGTGSPSTIQSYIWPNDTPDAFLLNPEGGNVGIGTASPGQKLSVAGTIESTDGGFKFPDGSVQTTAASVGDISVITGSANHNDLITPPGGYTVAQCKCIVSSHTAGPMGSSEEAYRHWCYVTEEGGGWRVYARSQNAKYGHYTDDIVNYMVIGIK